MTYNLAMRGLSDWWKIAGVLLLVAVSLWVWGTYLGPTPATFPTSR